MKQKQALINKRNENRIEPPNFKNNEIIFENDDRRDKLAPRCIKHQVVSDSKITVQTQKRKVHKQKIKPKRNFSGSSEQPGEQGC